MSPCQQNELYAAESRVRGRVPITREEAQKILDGLREVPWVAETFPQVRRIEVWVNPRAHSSVGAWDRAREAGVVEMAPAHMSTQFVLHEAAHVLCDARYGPNAHGPWFARIYLTLVYLAMGSERYAELYTAFEEDGIDFDTEI